jgi:hypothetical protein
MEGISEPEETAVELCAGCGRDSALWRDPISREGDRYCCPGCATGRGCSCEPVAAHRLDQPPPAD